MPGQAQKGDGDIAALEGDGWPAQSSRRFNPRKYPVPTVQVAGWVSGPVWTAQKISLTP